MGEIFGIGIEEMIFIGVLLALLFGPESIPRIARTAGRLLNRLFRSPLYREGVKIRKQINDIPAALARLAELEELQKNLNAEIRDLKHAIDPAVKMSQESLEAAQAQIQQAASEAASAPSAGADVPGDAENTIAPPAPPNPAPPPSPAPNPQSHEPV